LSAFKFHLKGFLQEVRPVNLSVLPLIKDSRKTEITLRELVLLMLISGIFDFVWYVQQFQPKAFLIENVTGLLDIDGGTQLSEALNLLGGCGYNISEPVIANAAHYGVPQNRNRLFVFGHRSTKMVF